MSANEIEREEDEDIQMHIEQEEKEKLDEALIIRSRKWQQRRMKKFNQVEKKTIVNMQTLEMPVEHLRKIVKDHGDLSSRKFRNDKRVYLGALKYAPYTSFHA